MLTGAPVASKFEALVALPIRILCTEEQYGREDYSPADR